MSETYIKVGDKLEIRTNGTRLVTELHLLEEKQRLHEEKEHLEQGVIRITAQIDELDNKLKVINK